jgi:hypothetical protein
VARTKEERDQLRAELEAEEKEEADRAKGGGGGRLLNVHADWADLTDSQRRKAWPELFDGDDDGGDGDDDGDDDDKKDGKKKKTGGADDDDDKHADRTPRRRGYFDSGDS